MFRLAQYFGLSHYNNVLSKLRATGYWTVLLPTSCMPVVKSQSKLHEPWPVRYQGSTFVLQQVTLQHSSKHQLEEMVELVLAPVTCFASSWCLTLRRSGQNSKGQCISSSCTRSFHNGTAFLLEDLAPAETRKISAWFHDGE